MPSYIIPSGHRHICLILYNNIILMSYFLCTYYIKFSLYLLSSITNIHSLSHYPLYNASNIYNIFNLIKKNITYLTTSKYLVLYEYFLLLNTLNYCVLYHKTVKNLICFFFYYYLEFFYYLFDGLLITDGIYILK